MNSSGPEYKTLEKCYSTLVTQLQQSPNEIATKLRPSGILAQGDIKFLSNPYTDDSKKAERIVDVVMNQTKNDPQVYHTFTAALKAAGDWTRAAVTELEQTLTSNQSGSGAQLSVRESLRYASPSPSQSPSPHHSHGQSEQSLYQVVEKMSTVGVDQDFCADERILKRETHLLRTKFSGLVVTTINSIERNEVTIRRIFTFLEGIKAVLARDGYSSMLFTPKALRNIEVGCRDLDELFRKLYGYYSWFNYYLIEDIINTFCKEDPKVCSELSNYKLHLKKYYKNRLHQIPDPQNDFGEHRDCTKPYVFKIDQNWEDVRFSELEAVRETIHNVLNLHKAALFLRSARNGCVELTFDLPDHVVVTVSVDQLKELQKYGIRYISDNQTVTVVSGAPEPKLDSILETDNTSQPTASEVDPPLVLVSLEHTPSSLTITKTQTAVGDAKTLLLDDIEQLSKDEITVELSETCQESEMDSDSKSVITSQKHFPSRTPKTGGLQADYPSQIKEGPFIIACSIKGKQIYWFVDSNKCLWGTSSHKKASFFYIKSTNDSKNPSEFFIVNLGTRQTDQKLLRKLSDPQVNGLSTDSNIFGWTEGPLKMKQSGDKTRFCLHSRVQSAFPCLLCLSTPVSLWEWSEGEQFYIKCSQGAFKINGYIAMCRSTDSNRTNREVNTNIEADLSGSPSLGEIDHERSHTVESTDKDEIYKTTVVLTPRMSEGTGMLFQLVQPFTLPNILEK